VGAENPAPKGLIVDDSLEVRPGVRLTVDGVLAVGKLEVPLVPEDPLVPVVPEVPLVPVVPEVPPVNAFNPELIALLVNAFVTLEGNPLEEEGVDGNGLPEESVNGPASCTGPTLEGNPLEEEGVDGNGLPEESVNGSASCTGPTFGTADPVLYAAVCAASSAAAFAVASAVAASSAPPAVAASSAPPAVAASTAAGAATSVITAADPPIIYSNTIEYVFSKYLAPNLSTIAL
jgi:hypothetical protein